MRVLCWSIGWLVGWLVDGLCVCSLTHSYTHCITRSLILSFARAFICARSIYNLFPRVCMFVYVQILVVWSPMQATAQIPSRHAHIYIHICTYLHMPNVDSYIYIYGGLDYPCHWYQLVIPKSQIRQRFQAPILPIKHFISIEKRTNKYELRCILHGLLTIQSHLNSDRILWLLTWVVYSWILFEWVSLRESETLSAVMQFLYVYYILHIYVYYREYINKYIFVWIVYCAVAVAVAIVAAFQPREE